MDVLEDEPASTEAEAPAWEFAAGAEIVPGYHAWALLGGGRRCESWLAWSTAHWNAVVLKIPRPGCEDERTYAALTREAEVSAAMVHPQIQRLLEARIQPPLPYLAFEYLEGMTLSSAVLESGPLAPGDVVRLGLQIASILHYVHGKGWVHLDVKPGNVAIRDGRAILMDFDLSLRAGAIRSEHKPRGTAPYMGPEQIRCGAAACSMDVFALGATLYEALTGQRAFQPTGEWPNRLYPQLESSPPAPASVRTDVPPALDAAIMHLLHPDLAVRPSTAAGAMAALTRALPPDEDGLWPSWTDHLVPP